MNSNKAREIPWGAQFFERRIAENGGESAFIRDSIDGFAESALREKLLKGSNRELLEHWRREFRQECSDPDGHWVGAHKAIHLAFQIGVFVARNRDASNALAGWRQELTAKANQTNRKDSDDLQEIIDEEAHRHWSDGGKKTPSATAKAIAPKVRERIAKQNLKPSRWKEALRDERRFEDVVRKRLPAPAKEES